MVKRGERCIMSFDLGALIRNGKTAHTVPVTRLFRQKHPAAGGITASHMERGANDTAAKAMGGHKED